MFHYKGASTVANCFVMSEISVAKIREGVPYNKVCCLNLIQAARMVDAGMIVGVDVNPGALKKSAACYANC